jgi:tetratricopeptide (TPR) repeat protein
MIKQFMKILLVFSLFSVIYAEEQRENYDSILFEGLDSYNAKNYNKAMSNFSHLFKINQENKVVIRYLLLSCLKTEVGLIDSLYKKYVSLVGKDLHLECEIGRYYLRENKFPMARDVVRRVLRKNSDYIEAYVVMGDIYSQAAYNRINKREGRVDWDEKLVFELAYSEYIKAIDDSTYSREAMLKIAKFAKFLSRGELSIFNPGPHKPERVEEYKWINKGVYWDPSYFRKRYIP